MNRKYGYLFIFHTYLPPAFLKAKNSTSNQKCIYWMKIKWFHITFTFNTVILLYFNHMMLFKKYDFLDHKRFDNFLKVSDFLNSYAIEGKKRVTG